MSFRTGVFHIHSLHQTVFLNKKLKLLIKQKKYGSLIPSGLLSPKGRPAGIRSEKASPSAPFSGSMTVETALVLPVFLLAMLSLICLIELMSLQSAVNLALYNAGKETASCAYGIDKAGSSFLPEGMSGSGITKLYLKNKVKKELSNNEELCRYIIGGSGGISMAASEIENKTGRMYLKASYKVKLPFQLKGIPALRLESRACIKLWNGYLGEGFSDSGADTIVYITDTGVVYHRSLECTHLNRSIQSVLSTLVDRKRNESGGKYYPCERCIKGGKTPAQVYIAGYGDRYHNSLSCSGLKRGIHSVPLSEAKGRPPCQKCGGN